jgi:hypothetical protein
MLAPVSTDTFTRRLGAVGDPLDVLIENYWPRLVGYIVADVFDEKTGTMVLCPQGTVFFVSLELGDTRAKVGYAVTCRHVIEGVRALSPKGNMYVRINLEQSGNADDLLSNPDAWVYNEDSDVAVSRFLPHRKVDSWLYPMKNTWSGPVRTGQDVFFVGMFQPVGDEHCVQPIVRSGRIAHPGLEVDLALDNNQKKTIRASSYLVESRSWGGESGSPVLIYDEVHSVPAKKYDPLYSTDSEAESFVITRTRPTLAGILHGHYKMPMDVTKTDDPKENIGIAKINSGIAIVIPVQELRDLLNHAKLVAERDQMIEDAKRTKRENAGPTW